MSLEMQSYGLWHGKKFFGAYFDHEGPKSACILVQSDQGLCCPLIKSSWTVEYNDTILYCWAHRFIGKSLIRLCTLLAKLDYNCLYMPHVLSWGTSYVVPRPGPEVRKLFSCSTQLSMKFVLFINLKILTKVLNFFHAQLSWASSAELSMKKVLFFWYFYLYDQVKFHAQLSWAWKKVL